MILSTRTVWHSYKNGDPTFGRVAAGYFPTGFFPMNAPRGYQAKWAKALFASAMRCTFSRVVMAVPSRLYASPISWAR
jgi:hypothetical protein